MRRAYILFRKGLAPQAIDEMRGALEPRDPDHYGAWNQLADWADQQKRADVYKLAAENMVRLDPHQPAPRGSLADALLAEENGRPEAKKTAVRTALELSPDYASARCACSTCICKIKNWMKRKAFWNWAQHICPRLRQVLALPTIIGSRLRSRSARTRLARLPDAMVPR